MKRTFVVGVCFGLLGLWCIVWLSLFYPLYMRRTAAVVPKGKPFNPNAVREIVFFDFPSYYQLDNAVGPRLFENCSTKCRMTTDKSRAASADAVIVYSHDHILGRTQLDLTKSEGQKWLFFSVESPPYSNQNSLSVAKFLGKFDWTMTYRRDSDFFFGYIDMRRRPVPASIAERKAEMEQMRWAFRKKSKMAAWMVSHCDTSSQREKYVEELKKHIQVDVYGACGDHKCESWAQCDEMVSADYKFYLSFENTLCKDYLSEKLFKILQTRRTVPVVRGGGDYSTLVPPNSVVNTAEFTSPAKLAERLKELANDEDAYVTMLLWGWDYQVTGPDMPLCQICERLHQAGPAREPYHDVVQWWKHDTCHGPTDL